MRINIMFLIVLMMIPLSTASEIKWEEQCSIIVHPNTNTVCQDIQITDIQFSAPVRGVKNLNGDIIPEFTIIPSVVFNMRTGGLYDEASVVLTSADNSYINQSHKMIKVVASSFTDGNSNRWLIESYNPQVALNIYKRAIPDISASLIVDKSRYEVAKDENINITLIIKNNGKEQINTARIKFNQEGLNFSKVRSSSQTGFEYCCLNPDQTVSYTYNYQLPEIMEIRTYRANTTIRIHDPFIEGQDISYNASISFDINPTKRDGYVAISKHIPDRLYTSDNVTVIITVANQGNFIIRAIEIEDVPSPLYPVNSSVPLRWSIASIEPNQHATVQYLAYPISSGKLQIPSAKVKYDSFGQDYSKESNSITTEVINNPNVKLRTIPQTPTPTAIITTQPTPIINTPVPVVVVSTIPAPTEQPLQQPGFGWIGGFLVIILQKIIKPKNEPQRYRVQLSCLVVNGKVVERNIQYLEWNRVPLHEKKEIARTKAWELMNFNMGNS